jgi:hypothetical protein
MTTDFFRHYTMKWIMPFIKDTQKMLQCFSTSLHCVYTLDLIWVIRKVKFWILRHSYVYSLSVWLLENIESPGGRGLLANFISHLPASPLAPRGIKWADLQILVEKVQQELVTTLVFRLYFWIFQVTTSKGVSKDIRLYTGIIALPCGHPAVKHSWEPFDNILDL